MEKDQENLQAEEAMETAEAAAEEITEDAAEEAAEEAKESGKEKKGSRKKKENKELEELKARVAELEDMRLRQLAEFENFRNRTEKEKSAMFETGAKSVIEKILPVVDNFERGLSAITEEEKATPFAEGIQMIYRQLMTEFENMGIKPIEAVGAEFNPDLHNAVMQVASEEFESGMVAQELMKGYTYRDSVVRHSMVAVAE